VVSAELLSAFVLKGVSHLLEAAQQDQYLPSLESVVRLMGTTPVLEVLKTGNAAPQADFGKMLFF
jgi:hypothetical protein